MKQIQMTFDVTEILYSLVGAINVGVGKYVKVYRDGDHTLLLDVMDYLTSEIENSVKAGERDLYDLAEAMLEDVLAYSAEWREYVHDTVDTCVDIVLGRHDNCDGYAIYNGAVHKDELDAITGDIRVILETWCIRLERIGIISDLSDKFTPEQLHMGVWTTHYTKGRSKAIITYEDDVRNALLTKLINDGDFNLPDKFKEAVKCETPLSWAWMDIQARL